MQTVSPSFAPYADVTWSDLRAVFRLVDTGAAADAQASANESENVSQLDQTHDETESLSARWAALETDGWPLDGSCDIFPDDVSGLQTGWWSGISGADGEFLIPPMLTLGFSINHSSIGFTVLFDDKSNQYPKEFSISAYDATETLIGSKTVQCESVRQAVELPATNYRKIVLTFTKTQKPYQRVRLAEVIFGIVQQHDKGNITGGTILYEVSPTAENLPSAELVITIDNFERKYNMFNGEGIYGYLQQGQALDVELGVGESRDGIEYVNMGRFYYSNSKAKDSALTARIVANDPFYRLEKSICRIGTSGTWTVSAAVAAVIADSGLLITAVIPSAIGARTVNKCIPSNTKHREALRLIAQAAMCTCYFNRNDELVFVEIGEGTPQDMLNNDNMTDVPEIEVSDRINAVELTVRDEYVETESAYTISNISSGETKQTFSFENPLVYDGNAVAAWMLTMKQKRLTYIINEDGNPAREIGDTSKIYDAFGENLNAVITKEEFVFDGTLEANTKGWG